MDRVMTVEVEVQVDSTGRLMLPKHKRVNGVLDLSGRADITSLPDGIHAEALNVSGTSIRVLPRQLKVDTWLNIQDTEMLPSGLPDDIDVGSCLFFGKDGCVAAMAGSVLQGHIQSLRNTA